MFFNKIQHVIPANSHALFRKKVVSRLDGEWNFVRVTLKPRAAAAAKVFMNGPDKTRAWRSIWGWSADGWRYPQAISLCERYGLVAVMVTIGEGRVRVGYCKDGRRTRNKWEENERKIYGKDEVEGGGSSSVVLVMACAMGGRGWYDDGGSGTTGTRVGRGPSVWV